MLRPKTANLVKRTDRGPFTDRIKHKECPLNDPDLPIVSELEHKTGRCYCHHCICGSHICATSNTNTKYSSWGSCYKTDYNLKKLYKDSPFLPQEYKSFLKTPLKQNSSSITQSDFKKPDYTKLKSFKPESKLSITKFNGRSTYEREYLEWKSEPIIFSEPKLPYRGYMVKSMGMESAYRDNFKPYGTMASFLSKSNSGFGVKSLVNQGIKGMYETTSGNAFKAEAYLGASNSDLALIRNNKKNELLAFSRDHFKTSYNTEFKQKPIKANLSRLRY